MKFDNLKVGERYIVTQRIIVGHFPDERLIYSGSKLRCTEVSFNPDGPFAAFECCDARGDAFGEDIRLKPRHVRSLQRDLSAVPVATVCFEQVAKQLKSIKGK